MSDFDGPGDTQPKDGRDEPPEIDIDAAFAAIVADFGAPTPHGVGPWPASEDLDDDAADPPAGGPAVQEPPAPAEEPVPPPPVARHPGPIRRIVLSDVEADTRDEDDEDEGFVPPEPPPFPRGDLISRLAWGAVIGGPAFLLVAALMWRTLPAGLLLAALLAFVAGFVTLVARMPADHPDDPDDGAVV